MPPQSHWECYPDGKSWDRDSLTHHGWNDLKNLWFSRRTVTFWWVVCETDSTYRKYWYYCWTVSVFHLALCTEECPIYSNSCFMIWWTGRCHSASYSWVYFWEYAESMDRHSIDWCLIYYLWCVSRVVLTGWFSIDFLHSLFVYW